MSSIKDLVYDKLEFEAECELEGEIYPWDDPAVIEEMNRFADEDRDWLMEHAAEEHHSVGCYMAQFDSSEVSMVSWL